MSRFKKVPVNIVEVCARTILSMKRKEASAIASLEERLDKGIRADINGLVAQLDPSVRSQVIARADELILAENTKQLNLPGIEEPTEAA